MQSLLLSSWPETTARILKWQILLIYATPEQLHSARMGSAPKRNRKMEDQIPHMICKELQLIRAMSWAHQCPRYTLAKVIPNSTKGCLPALQAGLFFERCFLFYISRINQCQEILRVKRIPTGGLLPGGTQGNVDAPVVCQDHYLQIV
jgi:hypothetical protein